MSDKSQFAQIEEEILAKWKSEGTFEKSVENRKGKELYSFYDGPPFANGLPHFGHSLVTAIKDSMLRYKTMQGYYVPRRNGWDCHGLPVEFEVEKNFGVSGKKQIMELGLEKFNAACRESIFTYKDDWEGLLKRIGRWSDYENYYATVDTNYTESVWWVLKQIHNKGLLYKGLRSLPYCPRCATPLSNFELNEGYKDDVEDPSFYITFPLKNDERKLLAWTTTPWSLGGNTAVAVNPKATYATVELKDEKGGKQTLVLAEKRLEELDLEYKIIKREKGSELEGLEYEPIYSLDAKTYPQIKDKNIYKVWVADFASVEDGTGVVHVAPATGVDDLALSEAKVFPVIHAVDDNGKLLGGIGFDDVKGKFFKGADRLIIEHLTQKGRVFAAKTLKHTYPFCWRCDTPLMYYAIDAWMVAVSAMREQMLKTAEEINWVPGNIKKGRFGKWLEGARDWTISRNRYWGAPMPIWQNIDDASDFIVVGSIAELKELAGDDIKVDDLHRPFIDEITFEKDGKKYKRIEEVLDCWFESGSMSVAQQHYPFENKEKFDDTFPADFIIEGLDQTRLWFYVQHVVATILFDKPAFKNVVVNGMIMAADGQKLSKRLKNYPPVEDVFSTEGADILRLYLLSSTQATETADYMRFDRSGMRDLQRNVIGTLWNTYKFFKMYTEIDGWIPPDQIKYPNSTNKLDIWILARLNEARDQCTTAADQYKIARSVRSLIVFVDDLSNWYVRRSRRRFWKSENDEDKKNAYLTLHFVLVRYCQLMAPWAPFLTDYIYRDLRGASMPNSVHLTDWPNDFPGIDDESVNLMEGMDNVRDIVADGLRQRAEAKIKVRQPLQAVYTADIEEDLQNIVKEELNVKEWKKDTVLSRGLANLVTDLNDELRREGLMRELVRHVQNYRKELDLNVEDRIKLGLKTDDHELQTAIAEFEDTIKSETLAQTLKNEVGESAKKVCVEEAELEIEIKRVKG